MVKLMRPTETWREWDANTNWNNWIAFPVRMSLNAEKTERKIEKKSFWLGTAETNREKLTENLNGIASYGFVHIDIASACNTF